MITDVEIFETPLLPDQGELIVLDQSGDTRLAWSRNSPDEVEAARTHFNQLRKKGHLAYKVGANDASKGEVLTEFDPAAERLIMSPRAVGG